MYRTIANFPVIAISVQATEASFGLAGVVYFSIAELPACAVVVLDTEALSCNAYLVCHVAGCPFTAVYVAVAESYFGFTNILLKITRLI
jgi:hypothetical protein